MYLPDYFKQQSLQGAELDEAERRAEHIEIRPSPADAGPTPLHDHEVPDAKRAIVEQLKAQVARKTWAVEHPDPLIKNRVPIDAFERRRLIREEIQRLSTVKTKVGYQRRVW